MTILSQQLEFLYLQKYFFFNLNPKKKYDDICTMKNSDMLTVVLFGSLFPVLKKPQNNPGLNT